MHMKQVFALLLCAAMLSSLTACGSASAPADATTAATIPTSAPTDAPDSPTVPVTDPEWIRLVDNEEAAFFITGFNHTQHAGMEIQVQCINKSGKALMFSWDMVSVCDYMYDPMWAVEVAAGKTAIDTVELDTHALEQMGIESVDAVTFTLRIYDSEDWMAPHIVQEAFTISPTGLNPETLDFPPRAETDGQVVIADNADIRFVIEGAEDAASYTLNVYMENKTDKNLMYTWDNVSVNGFMVDPFWAMSVVAGKRACAEITFARADLERSGIETVSQIEFTLQVSDYDDWSSGYLLNETYTYRP